ncbi:MAG TPA: JAB domain-containing protein [Mycobacteriales bacterium]|jgi:hypothetical protein|nr:JAB domain-containing protein [Mycobacteriales bacterium]
MTHDNAAVSADLVPYDAIITEVRDLASLLEGALLAFFLDPSGQIILKVALDEGTRHVDELFVRHLLALIGEIEAPTVVLASVRPGGHARRIDRLLFQELQRRLTGTPSTLADLLVIGPDRCWSAAGRRRVG